MKFYVDCEVFVGGLYFVNIEYGQGRFFVVKVKFFFGKVLCIVKVKILFVIVESNRCKFIVSEVLKELKQFNIKVFLSILFYRVLVCEGN